VKSVKLKITVTYKNSDSPRKHQVETSVLLTMEI